MNKSQKKLNIIDIVVFAVIIIAIGYAVYAIVVNMQMSGGEAQIEYVIEVPSIRNEVSGKISEGQTVYNAKGEAAGEVKAVSVSQAYYQGSDSQGATVYSKINGYNALYVTILCTAESVPSGYELNGEKLAAGNSYKLRTPTLYFEGECVSVRVSAE
jgi:hypothetical protein